MDKKKQNGIRYGAVTNHCEGSLVHLVYTNDELNSLRYYKGAVNQIVLLEDKVLMQDFYSIPNAYEVLNMLLYPGNDNEQARIVNEKRQIPDEMLDHMSEVLKVYENLATAIYKYAYSRHEQVAVKAHRFDREASLNVLEQGQNSAFLSATLAPDLLYFHEKKGLILEQIEVPATVEYLDFNEVLGCQSDLAEEREILFPPFLRLKLERAELTDLEKTYQDCDGKPPAGKYLVRILGSGIEPVHISNAADYEEKLKTLKVRILNDAETHNARDVWNAMSAGQTPKPEQEAMYLDWKKSVQTYVRLVFSRAKSGIYQEKSTLLRKVVLFQNELNCALATNNAYRKQYSRYVEATGIIMSVCGALVTFFVALSFVDNEIFAMIVKIIGLLLSCISLITSGICKSKVWEGKLKQRTDTYLKLDELLRDLRYEDTLNAEMLEGYLRRFKEIINADNTYCEKNTEIAIDYLDSLYDDQSSS